MNQSQLFADDTVAPAPAIRYPTTIRGKSIFGMVDFPGTGPQGETCGSCRHRVVRQLGKGYQKCQLKLKHWTHGAGTDIKVYFPACSKWEPRAS